MFSHHLDDRSVESTNHVVDEVGAASGHRQGDGVGPALSPSRVDQSVTEPHQPLNDDQHDRRQGHDQYTDLTRVAGSTHSSSSWAMISATDDTVCPSSTDMTRTPVAVRP